jgi:hypothetical protein
MQYAIRQFHVQYLHAFGIEGEVLGRIKMGLEREGGRAVEVLLFPIETVR